MLSIFLDNAIEASLDSITKEVTIALISSDTKVVIVENTIAQESINTVGIFKLGRSSKGEGRGIGLSTVREILGKYPNCSLSTQSKDYRFKQTLKIEDVVWLNHIFCCPLKTSTWSYICLFKYISRILAKFPKSWLLILMKEIFIFCVNKYNKFVIVTIFRVFTIYNNLIVIVVLYSFA